MKTLLMILIPVSIFAIESSNYLANPSNSALAFLRLPVSARTAALGGAVTAWGQDASAAFVNPALTGLAPDIRVTGSYERLTLDRIHNFGGVVAPLWKKQAVGLAWSIFGVDGIERRGDFGELGEEFADRENAIAGFYSYGDSSFLLGGVSARYYSQKLDDARADGYGVDLGGYYKMHPLVRFGLTVRNLLGSMSWSTDTDDRIAPSITAGTALFSPYRNDILTSLMLSGDAEYTDGNTPQAHGGLEAWFWDLACVRAGVELPNPIQYSGGIGIKYRVFEAGYAFTYHESGLGHSHLFSISLDIRELVSYY